MVDKYARNLKWHKRISSAVTTYTELFFYHLGFKVASKPKTTMAICCIAVILSSFGFLRYYQEKNPMKLWVPPDSQFVQHSEWLMSTFQRGYRIEAMIIEADDVLTPEVFRELLLIEKDVRSIRTKNNITFEDVCFQIPMLEATNTLYDKISFSCDLLDVISNGCYEQNILDLWDFHGNGLKDITKEDILHKVNTYKMHPIFKNMKKYEDLFSGVTKNATGHIVSAKALHTMWMLHVNFSAIDINEAGNTVGTADWASPEALEWESEYLKYMAALKRHTRNLTINYMAARSFGDISNDTMFQDFHILALGGILMVIYIQLIFSKYNWVEGRVILGFIGLFTIAMAFLVGCGLCSLIGIPYGPVHPSLPFLLMGLGVDDMFVILCCWYELSEEERKLSLSEKIGNMLKHAGVSITITSITDILAFLVGAYTILPSLRSYCLYAAAGIFMTFVFTTTFFVACFSIDERRIQSNRDCCCPCIKYDNFEKNAFSQKRYMKRFFNLIYSRFILTWPGKLLIGLITIILLGFSIESTFKLEQRFDPMWFIPTESYFNKYIRQRKSYYPHIGVEAAMYVGGVNYTHEMKNLLRMNDVLINSTDMLYGVRSWVPAYTNYVFEKTNVNLYHDVLPEDEFHKHLTDFLYTNGTNFQANFQFKTNLKCGEPAPKIEVSSVDFRLQNYKGPEEHLPVMRKLIHLTDNSNLTTGDKRSFIWSLVFASWITDEVIDEEIFRNMILALICVMICTAILIADLQTCCWIFICVLFTMINVAGFMQRWGLTLDVTSCVGLQLAIGLCVDYATHIGHTFLIINEGSRNERAVKTVSSIGAAVFSGGFSTLLGVSFLAISDAYAFQIFFKIFFLVTVFGLFHGVVLLPVILSLIGPKPYSSHTPVKQTDIMF
nr:protein patched homolog 1-like [Onthophagus taurus]